jgi:glutathione S-transferase
MKFFFSPGACSLSPHIVLHEAQLPFYAVRVDLKSMTTADGADFRKIAAKGYVPALELDDGQVITEGPIIVQYLADQKPESGLLPAAGTMERIRVQEWLNFVTSELHKAFKPLFQKDSHAACRQSAVAHLEKRFSFVERHLDRGDYLSGSTFTAADAYCFTILRWTKLVEMEMTQFPNLCAYAKRIGSRPAVRATLIAEGLIHAPKSAT